jgi:putative transposase
MKDRYKISAGCVYNINYHLVWCPKYRKPVLTNGVADDLKMLIEKKAKELDVEIGGLEIMPDHIHLSVSAKPTLAIHFIVQQFKGFTSHELRNKYEHLRKKLPTLWSRSYYVGTAGFISDTVIRNYIANQKGK